MARARGNDPSPGEGARPGRHYDDDFNSDGDAAPPDTYQENDIINVPLPPGHTGGDAEGAGDRG